MRILVIHVKSNNHTFEKGKDFNKHAKLILIKQTLQYPGTSV